MLGRIYNAPTIPAEFVIAPSREASAYGSYVDMVTGLKAGQQVILRLAPGEVTPTSAFNTLKAKLDERFDKGGYEALKLVSRATGKVEAFCIRVNGAAHAAPARVVKAKSKLLPLSMEADDKAKK